MSPLLEIALTIVFCLWVIPLTRAAVIARRSLPGFARALVKWTVNSPANVLAYVKLLPSRYQTYTENRRLSFKNAALDSEYRRLQEELILQRQVLAQAIATKAAYESKINKLTEETHELQSKSNHPSASQEEKERVAKNLENLLRLEKDLGLHELKLQTARFELEDREAAVQSAYSTKQLKIAANKADTATKNLKNLLASGPTAAVIQRMEEKVLQREAQFYAFYFLEDHYVSFPSIANAIERFSVDKLELEELKELLEALDQAASELHILVQAAISYERILRSQAEANTKSAQEFQTMFVASKICTAEFIRMHTSFAQKEREILNRISELENLDAKDSDYSREGGDSESP